MRSRKRCAAAHRREQQSLESGKGDSCAEKCAVRFTPLSKVYNPVLLFAVPFFLSPIITSTNYFNSTQQHNDLHTSHLPYNPTPFRTLFAMSSENTSANACQANLALQNANQAQPALQNAALAQPAVENANQPKPALETAGQAQPALENANQAQPALQKAVEGDKACGSCPGTEAPNAPKVNETPGSVQRQV